MSVGCVRGTWSILHPQQLALAFAETIVPLRRKTVVRIELEDQHVLTVVSEESVAVAVGRGGVALGLAAANMWLS